MKTFVVMPNGKVWEGSIEESVVSGMVDIFESRDDDKYEDFSHELSEAVTGSINGLTNFTFHCISGNHVTFSGNFDELEDDELKKCRQLDLVQLDDLKILGEALKAQYGLTDFDVKHALSCLDTEYENESICTRGVREIRCPASPAECDYVRITVQGLEIAYWVCDEWREAPTEVMGAIMGAIMGQGE